MLVGKGFGATGGRGQLRPPSARVWERKSVLNSSAAQSGVSQSHQPQGDTLQFLFVSCGVHVLFFALELPSRTGASQMFRGPSS